MLDVGISNYTNSRIRCNAELNGYTGYAELRAASSYDMFLNLSTTRTDGGWMYFKINNDDYLQLPGSDDKVNIYKVTTTSSNLTTDGDLDSSKKFPLDIKNSTIQTEPWTLASFHQGIANSGSWLQFSRDGTSNTLQTGKSSDNSYVTRASDATGRLIVIQNGGTAIGCDLDVGPAQATISIKAYGPHFGYQGNTQIEPRWRSQGFIHFNTNYPEVLLLLAVKDDLYMYVGIEVVYFYKPTTNASDDRLKENEELIEHAFEILPKLRPQLYDQKPDGK